jgi:hypothetical protein
VLRRLRTLSEAECYARCYGRDDDNVRQVQFEPGRSRYVLSPSGEALRQSFEEKLVARDSEAA